MALDNELYDGLVEALKIGEKKSSRNDCPNDRRVYKLFESKYYKLENIFNPVKERTENHMVSYYLSQSSKRKVTTLKIVIM